MSHLTRVHSDHCLVLLDFEPSTNIKLNRPFKFQSFCLNYLSFPSIVRDAWGRTNRLDEAVEKFTRDATEWNRNHFGNIIVKKRRGMARLDGAQKALAKRPSEFLVELEKDLQRELNEVLNQEQELWALKSRLNWMVLGDRNTSFFHVSTIVQRRRNRISCLKNSVGEWVQEETQIMSFIREAFVKLYTTSHLEEKLQLSPISPW